MDCIFCKIIEGEIPSYKVYEDDHVYAFLDITQGTKGHTLLVPKNHLKNIYELDEATANHVFTAVPKVANALKKAFNPIGLNVIQNNDRPLQSVFHFHVHLVPRYEDDGMTLSTIDHAGDYDEDDYKSVQSAILKALKA
ncbi:MAG: HIT family protein [Candidatus Izemoplasmataceae bacterium]